MRTFSALKVIRTLSVLAPAIWMSYSSAALSKPLCLDGREAALKAGGFSGLLLCSTKNASFKFVGTLREGSRKYIVYFYGYRFLAVEGGVMHGQARLIIFTQDGKYLGQYSTPLPPGLDASQPPVDVMIHHSSILLMADGQVIGTIPFKNGPPPSALIDGENDEFFR